MPHTNLASPSYNLSRCLRTKGCKNDVQSCCQLHIFAHLPVVSWLHLRIVAALVLQSKGHKACDCPAGFNSVLQLNFKVSFNPKDIKLVSVLQVDEGMKMVTEEQCDCIISFGGGSPHDAAKGIAVLATNGGGPPF